MLKWDADRYSSRLGQKPTGFNTAKEAALMRRHPVLFDPPITANTPLHVQDCHGRILCWYLPDALTPTRQVCGYLLNGTSNFDSCPQLIIAESLKHMNILLSRSMSSSAKKNWRTDPALFRAKHECSSIMPGTVELSPAWFQQGHDVSIIV
jgi:hypothetical protein